MRIRVVHEWFRGICVLSLAASLAVAADPPVYDDVEFQPLAAQVRRVLDALDLAGAPLPVKDRAAIEKILSDPPKEPGEAVVGLQRVLDPNCLLSVEINPESRVKVAQGAAVPQLVQHGWRTFLVKVRNEAGVTAPLSVESPNAKPLFKPSTSSPTPKPTVPLADVPNRWMDISVQNERPLNPTLSGLGVEYRLLLIYSRDAGKREAKIGLNVGQGTQDLGFRGEADVLFDCKPAVAVTVDIRDTDGRPTTASLLFRDEKNRVCPSPSRRLAPDFFFHPQIYRRSGETVLLAPGKYRVSWTRGPEYETSSRVIDVPDRPTHHESFPLKRWAHLTAMGWFSGDHHVHAAGCAHYESPTEGVKPEDMMRHIQGEDLTVGCVLSWGPCWYAQKEFFSGGLHPLSTGESLMRYDVEVSGFPSSHSGHLCLLRLKEDDYPGTTKIEEWPSWDLPVLQWGKAQGGVVGFSHSGWGLKIDTDDFPSEQIPPFDGIGANEYIVDVAHDAVDFISAVDTPAPWELNIWYHTLNCGFRTRISGETDFPCIYGERVGLGRSYVRLPDGKLDFDAWCQGIKEGRSYVTDGKSHLVDFEVGGVGVGENGSVKPIDRPGKLTLSARVGARLDEQIPADLLDVRQRPFSAKPYWELERARIGSTRKVPLEVVVNGRVVDRREITADGEFRTEKFEVSIDRSSWVALRIYPSSHTNPIWVTVGGQPVRASRKSAEWCLKSVDQCWSQKARLIRPSEYEAAKAAFDKAKDVYRAILTESKVD
ncbi:MAG: CehA/McbA family metallohydrolase [Isosphaeraceae bacterium]|nr:CehA/McbA family metallohydrolase [Isosphaeraceae bacterium]